MSFSISPIVETEKLESFGFSFDPGSTLTKRTTMTNDLATLLAAVPDLNAPLGAYEAAVVEENCLMKKTASNRQYTLQYLERLYGLSPDLALFRVMKHLYVRDEPSREVLPMLCAYARDEIIRASSRFILQLPIQANCPKREFEIFMDQQFPGRFGEKMLQSLVRNLRSAWTQSGHLVGRTDKSRQRPKVGSGAVTFALLLSYLKGGRGEMMFRSEYFDLLDQGFTKSIQLAEGAASRGWINLKRIGSTIEVSFPDLLTAEEISILNE